MGSPNSEHLQRQLYLLLIIFGTAALVLALYHIIKVTWYDRQYRTGNQLHRPTYISHREHAQESMDNSIAELIPAHKFQKGLGLVGDDGLCAVCLSDFEEGEELRTLPECLHTFHVPCIDMWFYSHSTCPICRAEAVSPVNLSQCLSEDGFGSPVSVSGPRERPEMAVTLQLV